jgi:hypothetical protein
VSCQCFRFVPVLTSYWHNTSYIIIIIIIVVVVTTTIIIIIIIIIPCPQAGNTYLMFGGRVLRTQLQA